MRSGTTGRSPDATFALLGCALLFAFMLLARAPDGMFQDPDTFWHIRTGDLILATWRLPVADPFSFTFAGEPWIAKEWLSQVLMAIAHAALGWNGVFFLFLAASALVFLALHHELRRSLAPGAAFAFALLSAIVVLDSVLARPHLLSYPVIVLWAGILFRAADEGRSPPFAALGLLVLWANLHAGFTLGLVVAGFAFLHWLERHGPRDRTALVRWLVFGAGCGLAVLVHPYGIKAAIATLWIANGNEGVRVIGEWRALDPLVDLPAAALVVGLVALGALARIRITVAQAALLALVVYMLATHIRFVYAVALIVPVVFAADYARARPALSRRRWLEGRADDAPPIVAAHLASLLRPALVAFVAFLPMLVAAIRQPQPVAAIAPKDALAFARSQGLEGNVLNSYNFGGFLVFNGVKTFVDGRTDQLFLGGFLTDMLRIGDQRDVDALARLVAGREIGWALVGTDETLSATFARLSGWGVIYSDKVATIHAPRLDRTASR